MVDTITNFNKMVSDNEILSISNVIKSNYFMILI